MITLNSFVNFILIGSDNNFVRAHPYLEILEKEPQAVTGFRLRPGSRTQQMVTLILRYELSFLRGKIPQQV